MRRHLQYQKRFSALTIGIVLVLLAIVGTIGWYSNHYHNTAARRPASPKLVYHKPANPVSAAADSYIIAKVGQDRFLRYFKAIAPPSVTEEPIAGISPPADNNQGGIRSYHFTPLKTVTGDDTVVLIVNLLQPQQTVTNLIPDCQHDKSACDFKVTRQQALAIAKKRNFSPADLKVSWDKPALDSSPLAIKLSSCSAKKVMFIDYRNGKVLSFNSEIVCPIVNPLSH